MRISEVILKKPPVSIFFVQTLVQGAKVEFIQKTTHASESPDKTSGDVTSTDDVIKELKELKGVCTHPRASS